MDTSMIASILSPAVAVALSPMPIAALLLLLLSNKARSNSISFLVGWVLGLALLIGIAIFYLDGASAAIGGGKPQIKILLDGSLGIILLILALREWQGRPKAGQTPSMPKWMHAVEAFSPAKSLGVGFLFAMVNVKNTPMGIIAGTNIASHTSTASAEFFGVVMYLLIASISIAVPVMLYLVFGKKMHDSFTHLKSWMIANNNVILFVSFLILGADLISRALSG